MNQIKVFIVEDSILMLKIIEDILSSDPQIKVVGKTKYGHQALKMIPELSPDIVTLDVNLPDLNGLTVLKELMTHAPTRVVMLSAYTQRGAAVTIKALELGALDFIPKPSGEISLDLYNFKTEIISKIKLVSSIDISKTFALPDRLAPVKLSSVRKLVVIGASTGGPQSILEIMTHLPASIDATFLIVQHMPLSFTKSFAERISWYSSIKTKEAEEGDILLNGAAYVAPAGFHMIIEKTTERKDMYCVRLDETTMVNYVRPSVDVTMNSVAEVFTGDKMLGVVLTGMGKDGVEGCRKIKEKGGRVVVQDEQSSAVYGMPKAVVTAGIADEILPLTEMSNKIVKYLSQ